MKNSATQIPEPALSRLVFADTRLAWVWLILRIYIGWEWLQAGLTKISSSLWTGDKAGMALQGFLKGALKKSTGEHPDVSGWYGLDRYLLPLLGTPWQPGKLFKKK